ncbi:MAG: LOG family protein [Parcubacteria group bacterium]|nr:LOG family protein [Parcubacteria group bacterium]
MNQNKHAHNKIKLCISGAAETRHCGMGAMEQAESLGREIARAGAVLVTGATTGFPLWAAIGAKDQGGFSIGLSPASSEKEHVETYRLPLDYLDVVVYTGFGYSGRNLLLTRASDAVFVGCGRIGTINEFTVAYEDGKPVGVLEGGWMTDEVIKYIMNESHRTNNNIVFDSDPKRLVERVIALVQKNKAQERVYHNSVGRPTPLTHGSPYKIRL